VDGSATLFYRVCDTGIRVKCREPHAQRIDWLWQQIFALQPGVAGPSLIHLDLNRDGVPPAQPEAGEVVQSPHLQIWKTDAGFYLRAGAAVLTLDQAHGSGEGWLDECFWQTPLWAQRDFFLLALVMTLHGQRRYGLHANGVVLDGRGLLIVGVSGSGKSTLTVALVHAGCSYLSDDVVVLHEDRERVDALALRRGFALTLETLAAFPAFNGAGTIGFDLDGRKRLVRLEKFFPDCFAARCQPQMLLFPQIERRERSVLSPIDETAALLALLPASAGIVYDRVAADRQMALLKRLVEQSRCYRLQLGQDVYTAPTAVAHLLAQAI
jgi:hypothetical protein